MEKQMKFEFSSGQESSADSLMYQPSWIDNAFTLEEIDQINKHGSAMSSHRAMVGMGNGVVDERVRKTSVSWLTPEDTPAWFFQRLEDLFVSINKKFYNFDLIGVEPVQYTNYLSSSKDEYRWHSDMSMNDGYIRKLSCSILLSDPTEYEGGQLIVSPQGNPFVCGDKLGRATFFTSLTPHCVTPVHKGNRRVLVIWAYGPVFK